MRIGVAQQLLDAAGPARQADLRVARFHELEAQPGERSARGGAGAGRADDLVKQISAGASIADVAKSAGVAAKSATDIHRDEQSSLPEAVVAAIFREPADGAGSAATPDGRVVFKITADRTPPVEFADPRVKEMASRLDASTRESLLDQYVAALRRSLGVVVHQDTLQSAEGS